MMKTKFFTGKGDGGKSTLGGCVITKDDIAFKTLGDLDMLNSWLGLCKIEAQKVSNDDFDLASTLNKFQEIIFIVQAEVASVYSKNKSKICVEKSVIVFLENVIAKIDAQLPEIKNFIIPGGSELAARLDVARAFARNVEISVVELNHKSALRPELLQFLNRLSSALFAMARYANFKLKIKESHPHYKIC